ncbi:TetR/AcrR family transcriptional regulator [Arthrobacter sp. AK01]|uniref:TetR/AcrR family transcriptional regulator n=1 Tax=Micrococcaceae TaxID=1268 RepID=UPI001E62A9D8|nr:MULTISPECIES: TetR/AcrR family transcriptional regulator [Micrococcaceae]MCD4849435.1 TetR/AcrR family transcriptional regulator [Arthrobacter sp. AK01]MCP1410934.1 AcrR family transcriptional regulator [Paenarthrobacter sp. A20]
MTSAGSSATKTKGTTPRERARTQTIADIIRLGREHLAVHGAAALSLRAVARDLGVVSSAVYRYVENRDELLTLLLIDAYNELGDHVDAAVGAVPQQDFAGQFRALGNAVRAWAIREPASYALLFGSPVPGYQAPGERTTVPGTRVIVRLVGIFDAAYRAGALNAEVTPAVVIPPALAADLAAIRAEMNLGAPDPSLARGVLAWTSVFGAISFEVFGQYGAGTFAARDELFAHQLSVLQGVVGLQG